MAKGENGYSARKGAMAAARKVLGSDAVLDAEYEVFEIEGGRFDWKAVETKKKSRRTSGKPSPFAATPVLDALPIPGAAEPVVQPAPEPVEPEEEHKPSAAASAFGAFANGQLGNNHTEKRSEAGRRASDKAATERKVRTPAEIVNGVRRPSVGTVCREVWDALDALSDHEAKQYPDSKQVRALAESKKWNANNASIEFYQWRKFHGITGRSKPAAVAAKSGKAKPV